MFHYQPFFEYLVFRVVSLVCFCLIISSNVVGTYLGSIEVLIANDAGMYDYPPLGQ